MTEAVAHRGPDSDGYYYGNNFALGHRRLAIIDLSSSGNQPMRYRDKYTIITNGEIYNYVELREKLIKDGYHFRSQSDTEVILAAYDRWHTSCVEHFNGMWAFVLYDSARNILFCSRDRFGIKPFYYCQIENQFLVASEIKQFTVHPAWKARLNHRRAHEFLLSGIKNQGAETLFESVYQLPGGHNLIYRLDSHRYEINQWYNPAERISHSPVDFPQARNHFTGLLTDAVRLRLRSDVKVGSCLSGGLDSSTIVCTANNLLREKDAQHRQETVSSCFRIAQYDEQPYIDEIAQKTGIIAHRVYPHFDDLFDQLDRIIRQQDEPFVSTSIFAQWEVFRSAAQNRITVMLDGQGADELLAGYPVFYGKLLATLADRLKFAELFLELKKIAELQNLRPSAVWRMMLGNLPPYTLRRLYRRFTRNDLASALNHNNISHITEPWQQPTRTVKQESMTEIQYSHLPTLLHYEDRNSMAHSVEARLPFLDYRLVEFVLGLPDDYKIRLGATKYILRESGRNLLPDNILNRHDKMGFVTPEKVWLRQNPEIFRRELENTIDVSSGLINRKIIDIFDAIISGRRDFDFTVWRFIAFGRWLKEFDVSVEN